MPSPPSPLSVQNSFTSARFLVEIQGMNTTTFTELAGIEVDVAVLPSSDGTGQKQPGQATYPNLTVRRPLTRDLTLWNWMQQAIVGTVSPLAMGVRLLDGQGKPVLMWNFKNAFPVKWTGPALNAQSNDVAMETLVIAHSGFGVVAGTV